MGSLQSHWVDSECPIPDKLGEKSESGYKKEGIVLKSWRWASLLFFVFLIFIPHLLLWLKQLTDLGWTQAKKEWMSCVGQYNSHIKKLYLNPQTLEGETDKNKSIPI